MIKYYLIAVFLLHCTLGLAQAPQTTTGQVTDNEGLPLAGVSVVEKGTTNGTITNSLGRYSISLPNRSSRLTFSFSGFRKEDLAVSGRAVIDLQMIVSNRELNEVLVTGYSSQKRRDITGAVASVSAKDLESVPGNNVAQQLQGRAAGVSIGNDGSPGADITVRIRGIGSITGNNNPLYIIDGVPTTENLNSINPYDIETLQVLKDAASSSIYGARANNGVIIIMTKKGLAGKSKLTFDAYYGAQKLTGRLPKFVNLAQEEYLSKIIDPLFGATSDAFLGDFNNFKVPDFIVSPGIGVSAGDPRADPSKYDIVNNPITKPNVEGGDYWYRQLYHVAPMQNYNLGLSGGSENGRYAFSLGYQNQDGILKFTGFKRYSLRINTEFQIAKFLHIGENLSGSFTDRVATFRHNDNSPLAQVNTTFFQPVYDIKGNFTGSNQGNFYINPYSILYWNKDNHDYTARLFGNTYLEADILKGLKARSSYGIDLLGENASNFNPTQTNQATAVPSTLDVYNHYVYNWTWTNTLNYSLNIDHQTLALTAGTEAIRRNSNYYDTQKTGFAFETPPFRYLDAGSKIIGGFGSPTNSTLFSLFAKADYSVYDRYLLSATVRRDGSSRFSASNRYGVFPAISAGWRLSKEDFLRDVSFIEDLKLRGSWGKTGNQEIDENNQYTTYAQSIPYNYDFGGTSNSTSGIGIAKARAGNNNTRWEAQTMTNLGLDFALFKGSFTGSVDVYDRKTSGLLLSVPHAATDGQTSFGQVNVGSVQNRGLEIQLGYTGQGASKEFHYGLNGNIAFDRNKVLSLFSGPDSYLTSQYNANGFPEPTRTAVGHPISSFYGYVIQGIFQTQQEANAAPVQGGNAAIYNQPGRWKFKDINHDGIIDDKDQTYIGSPLPKFTYGLNFTASYKGFDATLFVQGVYGNEIFNAQLLNTDFSSVASFQSVDELNTWSPTNRHSLLPKINPSADGLERQPSTFEIANGSYLRIKNAQIGYTISPSIAKKMKFSRIHFYVQASNLLTLTKYKGQDPEVGTRYNGNDRATGIQDNGNGADRTIGIDRGVYPLAQTFLLGVQLGL